MALDQLFTGALLQYKAFGLLANLDHPAFKDDLMHFISDHGLPLATAFAALPDNISRQACIGLPYLQCSSITSPDAPPGGYFEDQTNIDPGTLLSSRYTFWTMQHLEGSANSIYYCLVRAALYVLHTRDFNASVRYLLDLQKHGYLLNSHSLQHCLTFLLMIRQRVNTDDDIVPLCIAGQPQENADWHNAKLLPLDIAVLPVVRPAQEGLAYILLTAENDIEEVRAAKSYDEWVLGQHYLGNLMLTVLFILRYLNMEQELAFRSFDVRYEEICADCFAFYHMIRGEPERYPFEVSFTFSYAPLRASQMVGGDWQDRLCDERVLIPDQLAALLLPSDGTINSHLPLASVPPAWRLLSPAVAPVYANVVVRNPEYRSLARRTKSDSNTSAAPPDIPSLARSIRQEPENELVREQLLDLYPYCDICLFMEALYRDSCSDLTTAMTRLQQAILIDPIDHQRWHSVSVILRKLENQDMANQVAAFARTLLDAQVEAN